MDFKKEEWDNSYKKKDNFTFYPNEEVIRFVSKYIKKKIDIKEYYIKANLRKCLDLSCGIWRHILYLDDLGFDVYGIDISDEAIKFAYKWFDYLKRIGLKDKLTVGSSTNLPYSDSYFDFIISHGVLDSMNYNIAKESIREVLRVLKNKGLFYFDVISGCDYNHFREYEGEEVVCSGLEKGTIQSYFNWRKINALLDNKFKILDCILIQRESIVSPVKNSRYHIVAKKI